MLKYLFDETQPLRDFDGQPISTQDFALFYNIHELPSFAFVDGDGREIAAPLVNNGAYEFFSHILNRHIEQAIAQIESDS